MTHDVPAEFPVLFTENARNDIAIILGALGPAAHEMLNHAINQTLELAIHRTARIVESLADGGEVEVHGTELKLYSSPDGHLVLGSKRANMGLSGNQITWSPVRAVLDL